jgi:predicted acetyltransferase
MARFYVYDMSRSCGFISKDWVCPSNGLYESYDFLNYFEDSTRSAYLIYVQQELAGFVLINKQGISLETNWNMGEFFILAKFQGKGIGSVVAEKLWCSYPGIWEVSVIPENKAALSFWRKAVLLFTSGLYSEEIKGITYDQHQKYRYILRFNTTEININPQTKKPLTLKFIDILSKDLEARMSQGLIAYERDYGIDVNYQSFSIVLLNEHQVVCGILNAYTAFAEVYVDDIWVDSIHRGQGYGKKLMQALEERFSGKGFNNINLVTSAFQAPGFYKKCGFTAEFIRENKYNPQLSKLFFVKFFPDKEQTQGLNPKL